MDKETFDKIDSEIENKRREIEILEKKYESLKSARITLQAICKHEWEPNGYDSHNDHYKCKICGETC